MPALLDIFLIGILVMQDDHERQIIWSRFYQSQQKLPLKRTTSSFLVSANEL